MAKLEILAAAQQLGVTMTTEFIPWSKSRNAKPTPKISDRSLNWRVTLHHKGRVILTADYTAGIGHCPSYNWRDAAKPTLRFAEAIAHETETGTWFLEGSTVFRGKPILPDFADVLTSFAADSDVLDHPTFESWASEFGYDTDSKAEAIYRACLDITLRLRASIGEDGLALLREAASAGY